ncbi:MAG TPA: HAD family hydrolase [Pseudonocardiaceae bacterium]|jgi:putative hydrolase of the HAD superfamily|nr:HAD family hydrolase [Pseudonocardiaceae bacterium]
MRAVIFDWGGTLTPWRSVDPGHGWRAYADVVHAEQPERAGELAVRLLAAEDAAWARTRADSSAFTFASVLAACGIDEHPDAVRSFRTFWEPSTYTDPDVATVLTELRQRGLRTGVLSSTSWPGAWHEEILRRDGVLDHFDACVWSSQLAWTKPHPEAFRAAMHAVGVDDPAECVYVGDRLYDDISGAKGVGMRAVLVPHSKIPPEQLTAVDVEPDAVIDRLTDLLALVDNWLAA